MIFKMFNINLKLISCYVDNDPVDIFLVFKLHKY